MGKTLLGQGVPEEFVAVKLRVVHDLILDVLKLLVVRCFCLGSRE